MWRIGSFWAQMHTYINTLLFFACIVFTKNDTHAFAATPTSPYFLSQVYGAAATSYCLLYKVCEAAATSYCLLYKVCGAAATSHCLLYKVCGAAATSYCLLYKVCGAAATSYCLLHKLASAGLAFNIGHHFSCRLLLPNTHRYSWRTHLHRKNGGADIPHQ